jgi:hypothetical protein
MERLLGHSRKTSSGVWFGRGCVRRLGFSGCFIALLTSGCATKPLPRETVAAASSQPIRHRFPLPNGTSVGTDELAGRWTIILFLTTYDTLSQALARRLEDLRHTHTPRINVLGVALEPPQNAPLVGFYRDTLALGFPVALADQDTLDGRGPFGDVRTVPALVLLDRQSRIVCRGLGTAALADIEVALANSGATTR